MFILISENESVIKPSVGQDTERQEFSDTVGKGVNWYPHLGDSSVLAHEFEEVHALAQ